MTGPAIDTRAAQARRVADHLERHLEGSTLAELDAACDLGSPTKVLSAMRLELGYGVGRGPVRLVPCADGKARRRVRTFTLLWRPAAQRQLSLPIE